ncbi:hypothetical protein MNV49_000319 [Pseudohyphozyma bogoriensis]|nr:hypothetical protein MNV49_000319 [Pseudohyphozyma bogoriensis]
MARLSAAVLLSLLAASAHAFTFTTGAGRFDCTVTTATGTTGNQDACDYDTIFAAASADPIGQFCIADVAGNAGTYGTVDGAYKNEGYIPRNSVCTKDPNGTNWYCGYVGAECNPADTGADTNCDNGSCVANAASSLGGYCAGALGSDCSADSDCSGNLYCTDQAGDINAHVPPTCGGGVASGELGATCDDGCNGGDYLCSEGTCDPTTLSCISTLSASARARARRDNTPRGSRCPASHSACPLPGAGFECIDTATNVEQCGACASQGGINCAEIPGVESVGCVDGQCEIWSCAETHVWDASSASCLVSDMAQSSKFSCHGSLHQINDATSTMSPKYQGTLKFGTDGAPRVSRDAPRATATSSSSRPSPSSKPARGAPRLNRFAHPDTSGIPETDINRLDGEDLDSDDDDAPAWKPVDVAARALAGVESGDASEGEEEEEEEEGTSEASGQADGARGKGMVLGTSGGNRASTSRRAQDDFEDDQTTDDDDDDAPPTKPHPRSPPVQLKRGVRDSSSALPFGGSLKSPTTRFAVVIPPLSQEARRALVATQSFSSSQRPSTSQAQIPSQPAKTSLASPFKEKATSQSRAVVIDSDSDDVAVSPVKSQGKKAKRVIQDDEDDDVDTIVVDQSEAESEEVIVSPRKRKGKDKAVAAPRQKESASSKPTKRPRVASSSSSASSSEDDRRKSSKGKKANPPSKRTAQRVSDSDSDVEVVEESDEGNAPTRPTPSGSRSTAMKRDDKKRKKKSQPMSSQRFVRRDDRSGDDTSDSEEDGFVVNDTRPMGKREKSKGKGKEKEKEKPQRKKVKKADKQQRKRRSSEDNGSADEDDLYISGEDPETERRVDALPKVADKFAKLRQLREARKGGMETTYAPRYAGAPSESEDSDEDDDQDEEDSGGDDSEAYDSDEFIVQDDETNEAVEDMLKELRDKKGSLRDHLMTYIQWIIFELVVHKGAWLNDVPEFARSRKAVENDIQSVLDSLISSSVWAREFRKNLDRRPHLDFDNLKVEEQGPCQVCKMGEKRHATVLGVLHGRRYHPENFGGIGKKDPIYDKKDINDDDKFVYKLGSFCSGRAATYHELRHWGFTTYQNLISDVDKLKVEPSRKPTKTKTEAKAERERRRNIRVKNAIEIFEDLNRRRRVANLADGYLKLKQEAIDAFTEKNAR